MRIIGCGIISIVRFVCVCEVSKLRLLELYFRFLEEYLSFLNSSYLNFSVVMIIFVFFFRYIMVLFFVNWGVYVIFLGNYLNYYFLK